MVVTMGCNLNIATLPDTHVASVEADLRKHLASQALGSPLVANRTIRSLMQNLVGTFDAVKLEGEAKSTWASSIQDILQNKIKPLRQQI